MQNDFYALKKGKIQNNLQCYDRAYKCAHFHNHWIKERIIQVQSFFLYRAYILEQSSLNEMKGIW